MAVLADVTPCAFVDMHHSFERTSASTFSVEVVPPKHYFLYTKPHGAIFQKTATFKFTAA
jgi:hypothetical protein